jgi:hypothetical protein
MANLRFAVMPSLLAALLIAACQPSGRTFQVKLPTPSREPLTVALIDQTGLITGISQVAVDSTIAAEPVLRADQTEPNAAILTWTGGLCDAETTVTFRKLDGGYEMNLTSREKTGTGCPLAGVPRGIRIASSTPIPIDVVIVAGG